MNKSLRSKISTLRILLKDAESECHDNTKCGHCFNCEIDFFTVINLVNEIDSGIIALQKYRPDSPATL